NQVQTSKLMGELIDIVKVTVTRAIEDKSNIEKLVEGHVILQNIAKSLADISTENAKRIEQNERIFKEVRRENIQTRGIWIAIAKKYNLFDDEDLQRFFDGE
ncbi:MAG: hypothetical protein OXI24_20130, partial [Candidatus Poribacteria bacterium]|nr:hypothetical protein [Candidatus Poribacteria bacterium]